MIDSSAAWVTATISVALTTLLFVIIQLTKTPRGGLTPALQRCGPSRGVRWGARPSRYHLVIRPNRRLVRLSVPDNLS